MSRQLVRGLLILLGLVGIIIPALPSHAQDDSTRLSAEEFALLEVVQEAFEDLTTLESFAIAAEQMTDQTFSSPALGEGQIHSHISELMDTQIVMNPDGETAASMGRLDQVTEATGLDGQTVRQAMTIEYVLVDDNFYVRIPMYEDSRGGPNPLPYGWVNLAADTSQFPGLETLDMETLSDFSSPMISFLDELSAGIVLSVVEEEQETSEDSVNGRALRVFTLEYDMRATLEKGAFGLGELYSDEFAESFVLDLDTFIGQLVDGASIQQKVWIGADDAFPYRVEVVITIDATISSPVVGADFFLFKTITSTQEFSAFNKLVTIEAPIIEE